MTPYEFAKKWEQANLSESAASQEHFIDICRLVGEATPAEADPNGDFFTFEKSLKKESGRAGFADVWRKNCFAWEYKGLHANLGKAYGQLQLYREVLGNPPLLVVCDFDRYEVHTNFNNTVKRIYRFSNADISSDNPVDGSTLTPIHMLRALFSEPYSLQPGQSQARLTEEAAGMLVTLTEDLRRWNEVSEEPISDQRIAKFVMRMIFCFFAADVGLIPKDAFSYLIRVNKAKPAEFRGYLSDLFKAMKDGGKFIMQDVPHFNGGLFDDEYVPPLIADQIAMFEQLNSLDWSDIEPSIFGTLFETGHRREQAQAARHALHVQRGHRAHHRTGADEAASCRVGGDQGEGTTVYRQGKPEFAGTGIHFASVFTRSCPSSKTGLLT